MALLLYTLSVLIFPAVFYQANFWTDVRAQTTAPQSPSSVGLPIGPPSPPEGIPPAPAQQSPPGGQPPVPPLPAGGLPLPPATGPSSPPGGLPLPPAPAGPPSPPGGLPLPPAPAGPPSPPGGLPLPPATGPSSPPGGLPLPPATGPPSPPGGLPPVLPSPPGGQPTIPPSSSGGLTPAPGPPSVAPGVLPTGPPSPPGGQPTVSPSSGDINLTGAHSPTVYNPTSTSPSPQPTGPSLESFLQKSLNRKCSSDTSPTDDSIGPQWDEQIKELTRRIDLGGHFPKYSCNHRCGLSEREAYVPDDIPRCYCDGLCDSFGDCCYDFNALCEQVVSRVSSNETCVALHNSMKSLSYNGYAVWSTCPWNWTDDNIRHKCQDENQGDFLGNLPVFDTGSNVTYRNRFCATCNMASNALYWKLAVECHTFNTTNFNFSNILDLVQRRGCKVIKDPDTYQLNYLKRCIPRYQDCSGITQAKHEPFCQETCLEYALPVCLRATAFRNPQCALCNGLKLLQLMENCIIGGGPISPSLTVLFDFQSPSEYQARFTDSNGFVIKRINKTFSCSSDEVYDPYIDKCKQVAHSVTKQNCTFVAFNKSEYELFHNNTVYVKPHSRMYPKTAYRISDKELLLCVNFTRNFTKTEKEKRSRKIRSTPESLQLLTSIGGIVSFVALILLLLKYILFPELRNLLGKILMNLASSLLLYQVCFFLAVDTSNKLRCQVVAVFLHYFALVSFMWMNVMAFDIHRTLTATGPLATAQQDEHKKRLLKYCLYSWMTPVLVVLICLVVDHVEDGSVGYGRSELECFISTPQGVLYSFVLPVGLLMLLNVFALGHTLLHMAKTRKGVQQVANQRPGSSIAMICVKMVSVMGVTWLLGVAANFKALSFLWYPFVVLNSLQGFFIFLSFAFSGRALELYKSKLTKFLQARKKGGARHVVSTNVSDAKTSQNTTDT